MRIKMFLIYTIALLGMFLLAIITYTQLPKFGRAPQGERLARIEKSPNYHHGTFLNQEITPQLTSDKSRIRTLLGFLFEKRKHNRPDHPLPVLRVDLKSLPPDEELLVWFGHSSYLIQCGGLRMLLDPVFRDASPVSFVNKPFQGTNPYQPQEMPNIDYLIITHDHWDHLDYETVTELRPRVQYVVCPLGVGEHFEYWGYAPEQIIEMDWHEQHPVNHQLSIHCLPTRHFSGRSFHSNQTLWASYMITTPTKNIYLGGDGGYGIHYEQIAEQFPQIHLALMENGQYNVDWRHIHLLPEDLQRAVAVLRPEKVIAGHNSKYALAKHPWDEPLEAALTLPGILTPRMGEVVYLNHPPAPATRWW